MERGQLDRDIKEFNERRNPHCEFMFQACTTVCNEPAIVSNVVAIIQQHKCGDNGSMSGEEEQRQTSFCRKIEDSSPDRIAWIMELMSALRKRQRSLEIMI